MHLENTFTSILPLVRALFGISLEEALNVDKLMDAVSDFNFFIYFALRCKMKCRCENLSLVFILQSRESELGAMHRRRLRLAWFANKRCFDNKELAVIISSVGK